MWYWMTNDQFHSIPFTGVGDTSMCIVFIVFLIGCTGLFLRHNLPIYLSVAALFLHSFLCNSLDELRTKKLL